MANKKLQDAAWNWMNKTRTALRTFANLADKEIKSSVSLADKVEAQRYRNAARRADAVIAEAWGTLSGEAPQRDPAYGGTSPRSRKTTTRRAKKRPSRRDPASRETSSAMSRHPKYDVSQKYSVVITTPKIRGGVEYQVGRTLAEARRGAEQFAMKYPDSTIVIAKYNDKPPRPGERWQRLLPIETFQDNMDWTK